MISYKRIYLLFLIPSYIALSLGFFYSYQNYSKQRVDDYYENYNELADNYTRQLVELDANYERLMKTALLGIIGELKGSIPTNIKLKRIAKDYGVSHIFIIERSGKFIRSTNESPEKIPNLYSFSSKYKVLISSKTHDYLTTPMIIPFPEKEPHKFLTMWSGNFFVEVGFKVKEISNSLSSTLDNDRNIVSADFMIEDQPYSFKNLSTKKDHALIRISNDAGFENSHLVQTKHAGSHSYELNLVISTKEISKVIKEIRVGYIASFIATLTLITILFYISIRFLRKKVKVVADQIFSLAESGDFSKSLAPLRSNKDFQNLIRAINSLLQSYRETSKQMAFQVAHDIRSPLEALKSYKKELSLWTAVVEVESNQHS